MVEACERRILEFPLDMDAREVAKELKREGWYTWTSNYDGIVFRIRRVQAKAGNRGISMVHSDCIAQMPEIILTS